MVYSAGYRAAVITDGSLRVVIITGRSPVVLFACSLWLMSPYCLRDPGAAGETTTVILYLHKCCFLIRMPLLAITRCKM